jgi:hypothetical protein
MSLFKFYRYLRRGSKITPLSHELTTPYNPLDQDWDTLLIMMTARAKDPHAVRQLKTRYRAATAVTLIPLLPPRRKISLRARMRTWLQRLEGSYAADPYKTELRRAQRKRIVQHGYSETVIPLRVKIKDE